MTRDRSRLQVFLCEFALFLSVMVMVMSFHVLTNFQSYRGGEQSTHKKTADLPQVAVKLWYRVHFAKSPRVLLTKENRVHTEKPCGNRTHNFGGDSH